MAFDPTNLLDGIIGYPDGMHAGLDLLNLKTSQCHNAINTTFRGGIPRTRPGFTAMTLSEPVTYTAFQGAGIYSLQSGDQLVCVVDGKIYAIHLETGLVFCLTETYGLPTMTVPTGRCWFCQAEHFFIIQDGESVPVIIGPDWGARLAVQEAPSYEVPTGTIMAYGHGRLFVVPAAVGDEDGRRYFMAGDICLPQTPSTLLQFTETQYLAGGGAMALPNELGLITGMAFMRNATTGTGTGGLVVFARGGASLFGVNAPRMTWQEIDISSVLFTTGGTVSPDAIVPVNSDLMFRAVDGIRSIMFSASASSALANVPVSGSFGTILDSDTEADMALASGALWNNYLLVTTHRSGGYWQGMAVIDLAPVTAMGQVSPPIASGFWTETGLHSLHKARSGGYPCLIMARHQSGHLELLKASETQYPVVKSRLYTGAFSFQSPFELKNLLEVEVYLSEVKQASTLTLYFRPRQYNRWLLLGSVDIPVASGYARMTALTIPLAGGFGCDPITGEDLAVADAFQFCFETSGNLKIDKFRARCSLVPHGSRTVESLTGDRATFPGVELESSDFSS